VKINNKSMKVLIVGSGMGGLVAGTILGKEGYEVTVVEKNRQAGGALQIFSRKGVLFDSSVHYMGGLSEGQPLRRYFDFLKITSHLDLHPLDPEGFDRFNFENEKYQYACGYDLFYEKLLEKFPKEKEALKSYIRIMKETCERFPLYNLECKEKEVIEILQKTSSIGVVLNSITSNSRLQTVLAANNYLYAGTEETPFYLHALVTGSFISSAWRCAGGNSQVALALVKKIRETGGNFRNHTEISRLHVEEGKVLYAESTKGERFYADVFISNIDPLHTAILTSGHGFRSVWIRRVQGLKRTPAGFMLHLILRPDKVPYRNYNIFYSKPGTNIFKMADYAIADWPSGYMLCTPCVPNQGEFAETISVMTYMRYEEVSAFGETANTIEHEKGFRNEAYQEFKQKKIRIFIELLTHHFPELKGNILHAYASTPLTWRDFLYSPEGSLYGIQKSLRAHETFIPSRTKLPNLFMTGQNIHVHGITGVTIGSVLTCTHLVGFNYLIEKIRKQTE